MSNAHQLTTNQSRDVPWHVSTTTNNQQSTINNQQIMVQLLVKEESEDWIAIASSLSAELTTTAVERDNKAGLPDVEIQLLRESGLLPLVVPKEYGGTGATWVEALKIVQELSKADGSIGQLYGNHLNLQLWVMFPVQVSKKKDTIEKPPPITYSGQTRSTRGTLG